jgi:glucose-1-phosphate thymidylyltransferase
MTQQGRAWGIVPAAGRGSRIQPLGFSKELLPVVGRLRNGAERPRAVSEYLVERMGGASRICFVIAPGKFDILQYFGAACGPASTAYVVQPQPAGLCDAIFRAEPLIADGDQVLVGLPDTIWFPEDALRRLPDDRLSFLLFPVQRPELFDAVILDGQGNVSEIQVKRRDAGSCWVWGAFKMPGSVFRSLHRLWMREDRRDEYVGTLVNAYLEAGGTASGFEGGTAYADVGTLEGYRTALELLAGLEREDRGHARDAGGTRPPARIETNAMVR